MNPEERARLRELAGLAWQSRAYRPSFEAFVTADMVVGLFEELDALTTRGVELERARDAALADAARLREALEWYADEEHYYDGILPGVPMAEATQWLADAGTRARAALAATEPAPDA